MPYKINPFTGNFDYYATATGGGTTAGTLKARQPVTPSPDGIATVFTLPDTYALSSVTMFLNGLAEFDITESGAGQITFGTAPLAGDQIRAMYVVAGTSSSSVYGTATYGSGTYS